MEMQETQHRNQIKAMLKSVAMYASETCTLKKQDRDRLLAFEMQCYRRMLRIRWEQKIRPTNEEVRSRMRCRKNMVHEKEAKPVWTHTVCRKEKNRLVKEVMFGMMEGETRDGRSCREWLDDINQC